jgi:hypothetical protein
VFRQCSDVGLPTQADRFALPCMEPTTNLNCGARKLECGSHSIITRPRAAIIPNNSEYGPCAIHVALIYMGFPLSPSRPENTSFERFPAHFKLPLHHACQEIFDRGFFRPLLFSRPRCRNDKHDDQYDVKRYDERTTGGTIRTVPIDGRRSSVATTVRAHIGLICADKGGLHARLADHGPWVHPEYVDHLQRNGFRWQIR